MNTPVYLNTAACGLLEEQALEPSYNFYGQMLTSASSASEEVRDNHLPRIRKVVGDFINAPVGNIAFIPNFSFALNAIVHSLRGKEKVMLYRNDYPSVLEPFRINGFDISWIEATNGFDIDIEALKASLLQNKIDILVISHVQWMSGYRLDLQSVGDFCKEHDIWFVVDATQSAGALQIDIGKCHVDVLMASNYKWMNAGFGTGIMYMSDDFLKYYIPKVAGNGSYSMMDGRMQYFPSIRSYEPGHTNLHGLLLLEKSIIKKQAVGIEKIEIHNLELTRMLLLGIEQTKFSVLGAYNMQNRSPIILIQADESVHAYLKGQNIITTFRNGYIRLSTHYYNTQSDVQAAVDAIGSYDNM